MQKIGYADAAKDADADRIRTERICSQSEGGIITRSCLST